MKLNNGKEEKREPRVEPRGEKKDGNCYNNKREDNLSEHEDG